jgi:hypothetical protein
MEFRLPNFDGLMGKTPEINWDKLQEGMISMQDLINKLQEHNTLLNKSNEQLIATLEIQHKENKRLGSTNTRLTWLTILIAIILGVPNIINLTKKILDEQIIQNNILKENTLILNNMLEDLNGPRDIKTSNQEQNNKNQELNK